MHGGAAENGRDPRGTLGDAHPETLYARALTIEYLATSDSAEEFDRVGPNTVSICEEALGSGSFITVTARHNLAFGLFRFGRWNEAEPVCRRVLSDRQSLHGPAHPLTLSATMLLSWILRERGLLKESIALARQVVAGQERSLGAQHPYLLVNRANLADALVADGSSVEARALAQENMPTCERILGADDPVTARMRNLLDDQQVGGAATSPLG